MSIKPKRAIQKVPALRFHKGTGHFRVTLGGRDTWLGSDPEAAQVRYQAEIARWLSHGRQPAPPPPPPPGTDDPSRPAGNPGGTIAPEAEIYTVSDRMIITDFRIDFAKVLIKQEGDDTKAFTFNVGTQF